MSADLDQFRAPIAQFLTEYFDHQATSLSSFNPQAQHVCEQLKTFCASGKMMRGSLTLAVYHGLGGDPTLASEIVKLAAAVELLQAAFLIHDDIMDQDVVRRGQPAIHARYQSQAESHQVAAAAHYGVSQGICVGDICIFMTQELIAELQLAPDIKTRLAAIVARQAMITGVGQMKDIDATMLPVPVTQDEVTAIYTAKTAHYTFCLPLLLAAAAAGVPAKISHQLEELGEVMGLLFQIKDDEIGLFGSTDQTGKPVGSDIREHKQTLLYLTAVQLAAAAHQQRLRQLYQQNQVSDEEINEVLALIEVSGARQKMAEYVTTLEQTATKLIDQLPSVPSSLISDLPQFFHQLLQFNVSRKK